MRITQTPGEFSRIFDPGKGSDGHVLRVIQYGILYQMAAPEGASDTVHNFYDRLIEATSEVDEDELFELEEAEIPLALDAIERVRANPDVGLQIGDQTIIRLGTVFDRLAFGFADEAKRYLGSDSGREAA